MTIEAHTVPGWVTGTWQIDPVHTHIGFVIKHMAVSKVRGRFTDFSGTIVTTENPLDSSATATITASSIDTGNTMRDGHIASADFFDAENHPTFTFASTGVRIEGGDWFLDGDLTMRGITRPVTLSMEAPEFGQADDSGKRKAGFAAQTTVNREDWGISFNGPIPGGGVVLANKVQLVVEVEADLVTD
jgi:polyisoprenoid-binding protein YceI